MPKLPQVRSRVGAALSGGAPISQRSEEARARKKRGYTTLLAWLLCAAAWLPAQAQTPVINAIAGLAIPYFCYYRDNITII